MRKIFLSIVLLAVGATSFTQQSLWSGTQVESPVVNPDGTVTFNIFAPKAVKVEVTGDFLPPVKIQTPNGEMEQQGVAELTEKNGVWTFTSQKLDPELYAYNVIVNGMSMLDPSNAYVSRDIASLFNIFIVSAGKGDKGDIYRVNEVPHGDVSRVWYDRP